MTLHVLAISHYNAGKSCIAGETWTVSNAFMIEDGPQPPKTLTAPLEILANLRPVQAQRIPLVIRFAERGTRYQTFLVHCDRDKSLLAIDEIIPNDGERLIRAGEPFQIECFYEGARLAWENIQPAQQGDWDAMPCHWISLPRELTYHQRRNAYRAVLSQKVPARLDDTRYKLDLEGELTDISATGCRLRLNGDRRERLQPGAVYQKLVARLPIGSVETSVELRHLQFDEQKGQTFCGLRFYKISGIQQRQIERFVNQLQRESRRNVGEDRFLG